MESIFEPLKILNLKLSNRLMMPPLLENQANINGIVTNSMISYYQNLAEQGAGSLILESAYVAKQGRSHVCQLGISDEEHLENMKKLVEVIKNENVAVGIRLCHSGARTSENICGEQPIGPSSINFGKDYDPSREFDEGDCEEILLFFVHAAERAEEVGADFIEINGTQHNLLDQCLSLKYNTRDDKYGCNSIEDRLRLSCDIIRGISERISNDIPISYFFCVHDKLEEGFTVKDLEIMVKLLEDSGVDIFHPTTIHVMNKLFETEDTFIEWVRKFTQKPIIAEGNIKSLQVLKEIHRTGAASVYSLDSMLLSRPQWYSFLHRKTFPQKTNEMFETADDNSEN